MLCDICLDPRIDQLLLTPREDCDIYGSTNLFLSEPILPPHRFDIAIDTLR